MHQMAGWSHLVGPHRVAGGVVLALLGLCGPAAGASLAAPTTPRRLPTQPNAAVRRARLAGRSSTGEAGVVVEERTPEEQVAAQLAALERGAASGEASFQFRLGRVLRQGGKWVTADPERAYELLRAAADQGHSQAEYLTGLMLMEGQGTDMNAEEALYYMTNAAEAGIVQAQYSAAVLAYDGVGSEEGERDYLSAAYWFKRAAASGSADAQFRLGGMLLNADGLTRNETWAYEYFVLAAKQGHMQAQEAVGLMLRRGLGVEEDPEEAVYWLTLAAERGDLEACYTLGCMHRQGEGTPRNAESAVYWLTCAADSGHIGAAADLGVMHLTGEGTPINEEGSAYWFAVADGAEGRGPDVDDEEDVYEEEEPLDAMRGSALESERSAWAHLRR